MIRIVASAAVPEYLFHQVHQTSQKLVCEIAQTHL